MVLQPHLHSDSGFPFCVNGICSAGLEYFSNQPQKQPHQQQQQLLQQQQLPQHADPNLHFDDSNLFNFPNLVFQFQKQWEETDRYIKNQSDQLRLMIQHQGKQHVTLLKNVESQTLQIIIKKDQEIAQAVKKRQELEQFIRRLEAENSEWKRVAREKEAIVSALYKTLGEEKERREKNVINDVESCCGENEKNEEATTWETKEVCKGCYSHRSCYLFLPCRHVAACKLCEGYLQACPICGMLKKASIEALFF